MVITYLDFHNFTSMLNVSGLSLWKQARGTAYWERSLHNLD